MKLEDQVCSLKYAKKLKDLGAKQDSVWLYVNESKNKEKFDLVLSEPMAYEMPEENKDYSYHAYSVTELGWMLPDCFNVQSHYGLHCMKTITNEWEVSYLRCNKVGNFRCRYRFIGATEANARAKMLIYLIENNLIDIKEMG